MIPPLLDDDKCISLSLSLVCLCLFSEGFPCSISIIPFWIPPIMLGSTLLFWGVSTPDESTPAGSWEDTPTLGRPLNVPKSAKLRPMNKTMNCWFIAGEPSLNPKKENWCFGGKGQKTFVLFRKRSPLERLRPRFGMFFLTPKWYCHWHGNDHSVYPKPSAN